MQESASQNRLR